MTEDFDAAVSATLNQTAADARIGFSAAVDTNPDAHAEDLRIARRTGLPVPTVVNLPQEARRQAAIGSIDFDTLAKQSPSTAALLADPDKAKLAHDDTDNMTALEGAVTFLKNSGKALASGIPGFNASLWGLAQAGTETFIQPVTGMLAGTILPEDIGARMAADFAQKRRYQDALAKDLTPKADGIMSSGYYSGLQSLSQNLLTLPLALGGPEVALTAMSTQPGGQAYGEARDKGISVPGALAFGASQATIEYATEKLPMHLLLKDLKAGTPFYKTLVHQVTSEVPGEQVATVLQDMNEWAVLHPEKPFTDYLNERPSAAAQTLIATVVGTGGQVSVIKGVQSVTDRINGRGEQAQQAEQTAATIEQLNALAAASKLRERDPETFAQFIEHATEDGPVQHVYIDAQTLAQSGVAEQVVALSPAVAEQYQVALETGGQVRIPLAEYASTIAGSEFAQPLLDHLKTEPNGFSRAEAKEYMQSQAEEMKAEVERVMTEKEGDDNFKASRDEIKMEVKRQLDAANRFKPDVNEAYSAMVSNFYAVTAAKLNITPAELFARYPMTVNAEGVAGANTLDQGPTSEAFKQWFGGSKVTDVEGKPLVVYHGTAGDLVGGAFDLSMSGRNFEDVGRGKGFIFFTNDPGAHGFATGTNAREYANHAAGVSGEAANIIPAYLSIKNPLLIDAEGWGSVVRAFDSQEADIRRWIKEGGHDGVIVEDKESSIDDNDTAERMYVVVDPTQIKSATGNNGNFDPNDANILNQSVFHGTPYHFDKFSLDHLGKGEGAQAFGWGLYFAGNKAIAEYYRRTLSDSSDKSTVYVNGVKLDDKSPENHAARLLYHNDAKQIKTLAKQMLQEAKAGEAYTIDTAQRAGLDAVTYYTRLSEFLAKHKRKDITVAKGQLYEVEIPEDDVMLLWDKPLSSQPEAIKTALKKAGIDKEFKSNLSDYGSPQNTRGKGHGSNIYSFLAHKFGTEAAAPLRAERDALIAKYNDHGNLIAARTKMTPEDRARDSEISDALVKLTGKGDELASKYLNTLGIKGIKYKADTLGPGATGKAGFNYVVFDDAAIEILNKYYQNKQGNRGSFNPATLSITLLKHADLSTFLHESGHFFLEVTADLAGRNDAPVEIRKDMDALLKWFGVRDIAEWHNLDFEEKRGYHEQFARGFEAYLFEGTAPSIELQGTFQRFRAWLLNVYKELKNLKVELTPEVRGVFDRMLASSEQIQLAEQGRSMMPLFTSPDQAGMTVDEFAAYQALGNEATQGAISELEGRGLRDMQWMRNAKGREIKRLQKEAKAARAEVEMGVRREVMSQPVYRAWQFLTNKITADDKIDAPAGPAKSDPKFVDPTIDSLFAAIAKLGGLNRSELESQWGLDKKEKSPTPVFGKPVFRREGGKSIDAMGEALAEFGYLDKDENGRYDLADLEAKFDDELRGNPAYSYQHDYRNQQAPDARNNVVNPEALGAGRLDRGALIAEFGNDDTQVWKHLDGLKMIANDGLHPDVVAELFGFSSGDELVRTLAAAETPKAEIDAITDQRMLEQFGELSSPEAIDRAADKAIHNDARARFVATEHNALAKATGRPRVLAKAAKEFAASMISRLKVRDIKPGQYAAAEVRAAKAAEKASKAGDLANAATEKRNELINLYATKAAYDGQEEVRKTLAYFKRFDTISKTLDIEYREQIEALLERFDLRNSTTLKEIDKRKSLAAWVESQREQGMEPDVPDALLNEAMRKSAKDMTLEELRGLRDTVIQIEHLGRLKNRLLTAKANAEYAAVRDEIVASIEQHADGREADTRTATTNLGRTVSGLKRFWAAHIKVASWSRIMDGGKDGGPMWEYFVRSANEAGDRETVARAKATEELSKILAPVLKQGKMGGKGRFFPTINRSLNRESIMAIALNVGNDGNLQRLLGGEGWTVNQIQPVLATLTREEWTAVQAVWDHFESYRPQIAAKERRIYGKEPDWVQPRAFTVTVGQEQIELRGGYYPIKYDTAASERAEAHADAEAAKRQMQGAYTSATTKRSFTKARADEVSGRPLLYTLAGMYSGVNDVIHDLSWHEWLIDANRLLRSKSIDAAIRNHYGPEVKAQFKSWMQDVAEGEKGATNAGEMALAKLRQNVSVAGLGFNLMSAIMQPLGLTQSIVRVGATWIGRGVAKYLAHPIDATRETNEKSAFMEMRSRTQFRELNELRNKVQDQSAVSAMVKDGAYFLMMRCQQMVDVPTWHGAYEKAIAGGNDEERAIALADQAVIDAQGGGQTKDLSAIERGGPAQKLFTVFYSFMNTALNIGVTQTMTASSKAKLMSDYLLLFVVPAVMGALLKGAITPGDDGDDDLGKLAIKLIGEEISYLMGLMFVVREFSEAGKTVAGVGSGFQRGYSGPAGVRVIADATTLAQQTQRGELDDAFRKALVNTVGDLFGLPSAQINRTVTGVKAMSEGKTQNPLAIGFGFQEKR